MVSEGRTTYSGYTIFDSFAGYPTPRYFCRPAMNTQQRIKPITFLLLQFTNRRINVVSDKPIAPQHGARFVEARRMFSTWYAPRTVVCIEEKTAYERTERGSPYTRACGRHVMGIETHMHSIADSPSKATYSPQSHHIPYELLVRTCFLSLYFPGHL